VDWQNFFQGIYYSLFPRDCWRWWRPSSTVDLVRSAILSGLLECAIGLCLLVVGFWHFLASRAQQLQPADASEGTRLYFLGILILEYVFHPVALIGIFLAAEGGLRFSAAFLTDEVVPSLPIKLALLLRGRLEASRKAKLRGPDVPDLLEELPGEDGGLRICTQEPKEGWRVSVSVAVDDEFYEIAQAGTGTGPRPFTYLLRKLPPGSVIRGIYRYDRPRHSGEIGRSADE